MKYPKPDPNVRENEAGRNKGVRIELLYLTFSSKSPTINVTKGVGIEKPHDQWRMLLLRAAHEGGKLRVGR